MIDKQKLSEELDQFEKEIEKLLCPNKLTPPLKFRCAHCNAMKMIAGLRKELLEEKPPDLGDAD